MRGQWLGSGRLWPIPSLSASKLRLRRWVEIGSNRKRKKSRPSHTRRQCERPRLLVLEAISVAARVQTRHRRRAEPSRGRGLPSPDPGWAQSQSLQFSPGPGPVRSCHNWLRTLPLRHSAFLPHLEGPMAPSHLPKLRGSKVWVPGGDSEKSWLLAQLQLQIHCLCHRRYYHHCCHTYCHRHY